MSTKLVFWVAGDAPAISQKHNEFLAALDLGIAGAYIKFCERVILTVSGEVKTDKHYIDILTEAYLKNGYKNILVAKGESEHTPTKESGAWV